MAHIGKQWWRTGGKTTFASTFPKPAILIDIGENGYLGVKNTPGLEIVKAKEIEDIETLYWYLKENNLHYPNPYFWRIVGEMGVKTVIGVDAHDPKDFSASNYKAVFDMIDKYQINFIKDFKVNAKK